MTENQAYYDKRSSTLGADEIQRVDEIIRDMLTHGPWRQLAPAAKSNGGQGAADRDEHGRG